MRILLLLLLTLSSCTSTVHDGRHLYNREVMPNGVEIVYHSDKCGCFSIIEPSKE
jgi:hypothetical protein